MKHARFLKSAAVLSVGGILAKGIGALYRVPLANLLGGYGMGLYQMAYPLFCLLLTLSSSGIPAALSRLVARETARGGGGRGLRASALKLFALIGACGTALMCLFAPHMSRLQGENGLTACYFALAPSVFLVSLIAVYRGYFQGKSDMRPTALSELVEQGVKACFGMYFALRYRDDPVRAVAGSLFAVTLSELFALLFLALGARAEARPRMLPVRAVSGAEIFFAALPVMAATAILPLSQTADSVLLVRLLSERSSRAVVLYGLLSGSALSLVSLPAALCSGLAAAVVPSVSRAFARGEEEEGRSRAAYALLFTLLLSLPCALGLFLFARPVVSLLYPALSEGDAATLVALVKLCSVSAVSLAGTNTLAACLTGMGRAGKAALSMLAAVLVKAALQAALAPWLSVIGAAVAANACYLVAFFLDLFYTGTKKREQRDDHHHRIGNGAGRREPAGALRHEEGGQGARADRVARLGKFA